MAKALSKEKGKRKKAQRTFFRLAGLTFSFFLFPFSLNAAPPSVVQMLNFRPKQEGIVYSTPAAQEQDACKVELIGGSKSSSNGWLLRDARGLPLRRYFDSNGDKKVDCWSYYHDGVEVYREVDSNFDERVDQYRWLNTGGSKWGADLNGDGKIDVWKAVSAEEASQEALQALIARDFNRLQTLFLTDADMKALDLPAAEIARIRQLQAKAPNKFQALLAKLPALSDKTQWVRFESGVPQCQPMDQTGAGHDLMKHVRGTILYENNGKHDFIPLGEMVQVGAAWRLVDGPGEGEGASGPASPELQALLDEMRGLDAKAPTGGADLARYNLQRADLIQRILAKDKPEQRESWTRQLVECLAAAVQSSPDTDRSAAERLTQTVQKVVREQPGSALASFVVFREMQADYAVKLAKIGNEGKAEDYPKLQAQWLDRLAQFVQAYPKSDETSEALLQLGQISEFVNKEIEAKNWYAQLRKEFPARPEAGKAEGALRRLDLEGKPLELTCAHKGGTFDVAQMHDKLVIVYYWASWNQQCVGDFARLSLLLNNYGSKGLELVCVNLDNAPPEGDSGIKNPPGLQLFQPGGLESPLATHYGIWSLPNLFLVGKDGKVLSRTVQVGNLEDEIKKHLK